MDSLRLILIVIAAALLLGIYLHGRSRSEARRRGLHRLNSILDDEDAASVEGGATSAEQWIDNLSIDDDSLTGDALDGLKGFSGREDSRVEPEHFHSTPAAENAAAESGASAAETSEPIYIVATLMAPEESHYNGIEIERRLSELGLVHGEGGLFHKGEEGKTLYSIANVLQPGSFDPSGFSQLTTPGLALFAQIGSRRHDDPRLLQFIAELLRLQGALGGTLCDQAREPLTALDDTAIAKELLQRSA